MVSRYTCDNERDALLPLPPSVQFTKQDAKIGHYLHEGSLYRNLVGELNHLLQCTCPDIAYAARQSNEGHNKDIVHETLDNQSYVEVQEEQ